MKFSARLVTGVAAISVLAAPLVITPAHAATSVTVAFTAVATVSRPVSVPPLGPDVAGTYRFDSTVAGGLPKGCVGVSSVSGADDNCSFLSTGSFGPVQGIAGAGATCLYSSGKGVVDNLKINGTEHAGIHIKVEWPAAAGSIIPFVFTKGAYAPAGAVVGGGSVQVLGAGNPGTCGIGGGSGEFQVTGFAFGSL